MLAWGLGLSDAHRVENEDRDELGQAVEGHVLEDAERSVQRAAAFPRGKGGQTSAAPPPDSPRLLTGHTPDRPCLLTGPAS